MDEELRQAGFLNPENLTKAQKELILQPSYAPENFHMDGEISPSEAMSFWKQKMARLGLTPAQIKLAYKMHYGR